MTPARKDARARLHYLRRYRAFRGTLVFCVILLAVQSMIYASVAFFIKWLFDDILLGKPFLSILLPCMAIFVAVTLSGLFLYTARQKVLQVIKIVIASLRRELLAKAYDLGNHFAAGPDRTRLHSLIVLDSERVDVMSNAIVTTALPALLTSIVLCAALLVLAPSLLLIAGSVGLAFFTINRYLGRNLKLWVGRFNAAFEAFSQGILSGLRRMELTRAMGAEEFEMTQRAGQIDDLRLASARMVLAGTTHNVTQMYATTLVTLSVLLVGGSAVAAGDLSLSTLAAVYVVVAQLGAALANLLNATPQIVTGYHSLVDIDHMLNRREISPRGGTLISTLKGGIALQGLRFAYDGRPVLKDVNLNVTPGERIAVMGANGAGKSTLALVLLGLYECQAGAILLDGIPLENLAQSHFRRQIGVVLQEPYLLAGSVADNISYGRPGTDMKAIISAAQLIGADAFVRALPDGYDTLIGAGGTSLSGGQNQLISLARAVLGEPKLLILDEPTNHLDGDTAAALCQTLQTLKFQPTILMITHDAEAANGFDRLCHLRDGVLIEDTAGANARRRYGAPLS